MDIPATENETACI